GWLTRVFQRGQALVVHGKGSRFKDKITLQVQDWELVESGDDERIHAGALVPVYSTTEGLHQRTLRSLMYELVERYAADVGKRLREALPWSLTGAQERVWDEIRRDMAAPYPMHRLLQGDVGSGKTIVAALAALTAIEAGYQAAVMAPTEILAEQHVMTFSRLLEPLGVPVTLLTSALKGRERAARRAAVAGGEGG